MICIVRDREMVLIVIIMRNIYRGLIFMRDYFKYFVNINAIIF